MSHTQHTRHATHSPCVATKLSRSPYGSVAACDGGCSRPALRIPGRRSWAAVDKPDWSPCRKSVLGEETGASKRRGTRSQRARYTSARNRLGVAPDDQMGELGNLALPAESSTIAKIRIDWTVPVETLCPTADTFQPIHNNTTAGPRRMQHADTKLLHQRQPSPESLSGSAETAQAAPKSDGHL